MFSGTRYESLLNGAVKKALRHSSKIENVTSQQVSIGPQNTVYYTVEPRAVATRDKVARGPTSKRKSAPYNERRMTVLGFALGKRNRHAIKIGETQMTTSSVSLMGAHYHGSNFSMQDHHNVSPIHSEPSPMTI